MFELSSHMSAIVILFCTSSGAADVGVEGLQVAPCGSWVRFHRRRWGVVKSFLDVVRAHPYRAPVTILGIEIGRFKVLYITVYMQSSASPREKGSVSYL